MTQSLDSANENDVLNVFHLYVPTPGDPPVVGATPAEPGSEKGTVLNLGAPLDQLYMGAGLRTYGHIFVNAVGMPHEPVGIGSTAITAYSRVSIQATGQGVFQTLYQPLYLLSGDTAVLAANNETFVTSSKSVHVLAGWGGTVNTSAMNSVDAGTPTDATTEAPINPIQQSYVDGLNGQAKWIDLATSLDTTVSRFRGALGNRVDLSDSESEHVSAASTALRIGLTTLSGAFGTYSEASTLLDAGKSLPLHATGRSGTDASSALADAPAGIADGSLYLSASGTIRACAPESVAVLGGGSVSLSAGLTSSLSALGMTSIFGGVAAEMSSFATSSVTAFSNVRLTSIYDVNVQARKGDVGVRGKRVQIGYAKSASEWSVAPNDSPAVGADIQEQAAAQVAAALVALGAFSNSLDPAVITAAALFAAAATAAEVETVASLVERQSAQSQRPSGSAPPEVTALDQHMPDLAVGDSDPHGKHVLPAADESVMQNETEDLFLKAKKRVRIKSNDEVQIGAAKKLHMRVGCLLVEIEHTSSGDTLTIAAMNGTSPGYPKIELLKPSSGTASIAIHSAENTSIVTDPTQGISLTAGQTTVTVAQDGDVNVHTSGNFKVNGHITVTAP